LETEASLPHFFNWDPAGYQNMSSLKQLEKATLAHELDKVYMVKSHDAIGDGRLFYKNTSASTRFFNAYPTLNHRPQVILLVRHPLDAIRSLYHFRMASRYAKKDEDMHAFIHANHTSDEWTLTVKDELRQWTTLLTRTLKRASKVAIIRYEDLRALRTDPRYYEKEWSTLINWMHVSPLIKETERSSRLACAASIMGPLTDTFLYPVKSWSSVASWPTLQTFLKKRALKELCFLGYRDPTDCPSALGWGGRNSSIRFFFSI
jgi:hypothetical protein